MEKGLTEIQKNRLIIVNDDAKDPGVLKPRTRALADKVQQLLLLSNISAVWSYLIFIVLIVRLFACFHGKQRFLMVGSFGAMIILLAILLFIAWKDTGRKRSDYKKVRIAFEHKDFLFAEKQCRVRSWYLLVYIILLAAASFIFFKDIHNGMTLILKLTAPVSVAAYMAGLYFIVKFKHQQRQLLLFTSETDDLPMV